MTIQRMFEPRRELGRTGFTATVLGVGDVADRAVPIDDCVATVRRAMDAGLNVVDTAPMYENGYSEEIVGRAVREYVEQSGRRGDLFVIDKIDFYDRPVATQVDKSLSLLGMDGVDLFVFHGLSDLAVWRKVAGPGGMMEELGACVKAGKTRFRGISSHHPGVLREAIESELCDVVMFAVGPFTDARYAQEIVPLARQRGVGTVCFKTFGAGRLLGGAPETNRGMHLRPRGKLSSGGVASDSATAMLEGDDPASRLTIEECLHFTMTCDPDVALLGMSFPNEQDAAFAAARSFRPLPPDRMEAIRRGRRASWRGSRRGGIRRGEWRIPQPFEDSWLGFGGHDGMKIIHLNHVALQVKDVAATTRFYEEVVGLKQIPRPDFGFGGAWFRLGVDQELHLIDAAAGGVSSSSRGDHFAMMVDSIDQAAEHLRARGVTFSGPKNRPDGAFQIFFEDPDGHVIEFCTSPA